MISVGIDVSKGKSTVCIMKPCGEILELPFDIGHTADELDSLISLIKSFDEETRVVMEDTGHYHLPVATYLSSHNIFVCCVNALRMKKFCSQSIRRAKTDKIDSIKIASLHTGTSLLRLIPLMLYTMNLNFLHVSIIRLQVCLLNQR